MTTDTHEELLLGRYRLRGRIGSGGTAQVFLAEDTRLGRQVAVKLHDRTADLDGRATELIEREARRAARLNHPNVVQVHDVGSEGRHAFIVMEHVRGRTLHDVVAAEGAAPEHRVIAVGTAICMALEAAHRQGLVHRDVKPTNVLIGEDGEVKLTDFGIARARDEDTLTREGPMGSAPYVAPEQITDADVDHRADLFSLGAVLFELATGQRPYTGETLAATVMARLHRPPPSAAEVGGVSAPLDAVIRRLLARDPDDRFATAAEAARALAEVRDGADPTVELAAVAPSAGARGSTEGARSPTSRRWVAVAAAVVTLAAMIGIGWWAAPGHAPTLDATTTAVTVPEVSGMTLEAAERTLTARGLAVGSIDRAPSSEPDGLVVGQSPPAGTDVASGTEVALILSGGTASTAAPAEDAGEAQPDSGDEPAAPDTGDADAPQDGASGAGDTQQPRTAPPGQRGERGPPDHPAQGKEPPGRGDPPGRGR